MSMKTSKLYPKCFGEIPHGWNEKRLKYAANVVVEKPHNSKREVPYIGLEHVESGTGRLLQLDESFDEESSAIMCRTGDVLFGKLRPYLAKCFLAEREFRCSSEFLVFRSSSYNQNYLKYLLMTKEFIDLVNSSTYGAKMPRASWDFIGNIIVPIPPIDVQKKIANYLDQQTAKLDQIIEKKKRLIELLQEKRQVIITQAVTKGLDPNVPMKDSGTEWLGEVPAHWNIAKLRWLIALRSGDFIENTNVTSNGCIPVYGGNGIMGYTIMANCNSNTIVIGRVGAMCGNVHLVTTPSWITDNALYLTRYRGYNLNYLYYLFQSLNLNRFANKTAQPLITQSQILDQFVPLPSIEEQESVVSWLTENVKKFDFTIQLINKHISLISEYRQALITATVTGQVDVRDKLEKLTEAISAGKE